VTQADDLVRLSGVSRSTVFRFLKGDSVRPQAREAILAAMQHLNISHDDHAVHKGKTLQIRIRKDFKAFKGYNLAMAGFVSRAEKHGFAITIQTGTIRDSADPSERKPPTRPAGVLILGMSIEEEEVESGYFREAGIPHVFVNRVFEDPKKSWVSCLLRQAACEATGYLLDLGHRDIGTWGVVSSSRIDREKRLGYFDAFRLRGLEPSGPCLEMDTHGTLPEAAERLIAAGDLPSAWFCPSDEHALQLYRTAREKGVRIPEDLSVVSMDDVESAEYLMPPLTTVRMPFQAEGAVAFDVLKHLMENPAVESHHVVLKHELIIRDSCAPHGDRSGDRSGDD